MTQTATEYSMSTTLDLPYEKAVDKVTEALKTEGFGVLTEINVKETLKKKLDADFRKYIILGACNPSLAHRALSADLDIGLLLPCNVVVYEEQGGSVVAVADPIAMLGIIKTPEIEKVAQEARAKLQRVIETLER